MKLILARHGETIENARGIAQGHNHGTLSEKGIRQAKGLAKRLVHEKIECIFSSDLSRAAETAKEVKKFHPKAQIRFVKELRELDIGPLAGRKGSDIDWENRPGAIESRESMRARVRAVLEKAFSEFPRGIVLFVGHAGTNRAIVSLLLNKPAAHMREIKVQGNAEFEAFEIASLKNNCFELK